MTILSVSSRLVGRHLFGAKPPRFDSMKANPKFNNQLVRRRQFSASPVKPKKKDEEGSMHFVKAGLPMILFCGLGVWVVSNGIEGKNRERDAFQGRISKSERQAMMDKEHDDMMDKMSQIMKEDFDNTKRIERPDEVLARRRQEREEKNRWYKRWWNAVRGQS
ncbi:MAG: hypothetical protein SGILL_010766 [Bacillariaceae sp.]